MAAETREFKDIYREADAEERFSLMMDNYNAFPKIIRRWSEKPNIESLLSMNE